MLSTVSTSKTDFATPGTSGFIMTRDKVHDVEIRDSHRELELGESLTFGEPGAGCFSVTRMDYSQRRASTGSMPAALRAGM